MTIIKSILNAYISNRKKSTQIHTFYVIPFKKIVLFDANFNFRILGPLVTICIELSNFKNGIIIYLIINIDIFLRIDSRNINDRLSRNARTRSTT